MRKLTWLFSILILTALFACSSQADPIIGKWSSQGKALTISSDGAAKLSIAGQPDQIGKWTKSNKDIVFNFGGSDISCGVSDEYVSQLKLTNKTGGNCSFAYYYWRLDPSEEQKKQIVSVSCVGIKPRAVNTSLPEKFDFLGDKKEQMVCLGKTGEGCQIVWPGQVQSAEYMSVLFRNGANGTSFSLRKNGGQLNLAVAQSSTCNDASCTFSGEAPIAQCTQN